MRLPLESVFRIQEIFVGQPQVQDKTHTKQHYLHWGKLLLCNQTLSPAQGWGLGTRLHHANPPLCLVLFMHPSVLDYNSTPPTCGGRDFYFPLRTALGYTSPPRIQLKGSPRTQLIWHLYPPGHNYFTPLDTITCPPET